MSLNVYRKKIDAIDQKIVALLNERANISVSIGKQKIVKNQSVYSPGREKQVLDRVKALSKGSLSAAAIQAIYREIMSASLSLEKPLIIAALGKSGAYTFEAAQRIFGQQVDYESCKTISDVFQSVESGEAHYGVVPVENSTQGAVTWTIDLLVDSELKICRQELMEISHNLLSKVSKNKITKVYSNWQVFEQCRNWLSRNLPNAKLITVASTTEAAEIAAKEKNAAAIASLKAGQNNGLLSVAAGIHDLAHNTTRFLVIGPEDAAPTGEDRTSIVFSIKDHVGALYKMLAPFYKARINLTKIESRPSKKTAWDYYFFVDFQGHEEDQRVKRALNQLEGMCKYLKVLGSYPVMKQVVKSK
ncbi:MAG: prephenate dehydratase [Candidatus Omnitrophica bacterium]|nr:prephenate dehydratase [Candidatus Omnitrophota bacterium]